MPLPDEKEEEPAPRYDKDGNRKRRKKDKNAPRKNRSAYIIWAQEYREKHFRPKASTPQAVSFRDQATQLGNAWKKMTDKDKKKYVDAAMREAQEYAIKRDAFIAEKKASWILRSAPTGGFERACSRKIMSAFITLGIM